MGLPVPVGRDGFLGFHCILGWWSNSLIREVIILVFTLHGAIGVFPYPLDIMANARDAQQRPISHPGAR